MVCKHILAVMVSTILYVAVRVIASFLFLKVYLIGIGLPNHYKNHPLFVIYEVCTGLNITEICKNCKQILSRFDQGEAPTTRCDTLNFKL